MQTYIVLLFCATLQVQALPSTVDIFTAVFLPVDPPFVCSFERRRLQSNSLLFDLANHEGLPEWMAARQNASHILQQLEEDLSSGVLQDSIDVNVVSSVSETLFTDHATNVDVNQLPAEYEEEEEAEGIVNFRPLNLLGFFGSGEIMLCAAAELFKNRQNPKNIGTILCGCGMKTKQKEGQCRIVSSLSTSE